MWDHNETLDSEMENNASSHDDYNILRLEGGSSNKTDDDLNDLLDVTDEDEPQKKAGTAVKQPEKPEKLEKPKRSKVSVALNYTKITIIVIVLAVSIVLIARRPVWEDRQLQTVLQPNAIKMIRMIDIDDKGKRIHVHAIGPFLFGYECSNENPSVKVFITEDENQVQRDISGTWKLCLVEPHMLDTVPAVNKDYIFNFEERIDGSIIYLNMRTSNINEDVCLRLLIDTYPVDEHKGIIYGTVVLIFLYFMIVSEIIDRTFASLIAAAMALGALALCDERVGQNKIITWIDVETLSLLVGMMILVSILAESGIFDYFAVFAYKIAKGRVWPLVNCLSFFTAFLAMFLDSVTMMLLATPVTIRLCEVLSLDPVPILICMVLFANVGAAMTPVGDPPNVIISLNTIITKSGVNFGNFTLHMLPGVVFGLIQTYIHLRLLFRKPESLHFKDSKEIKQLRNQIAVWTRTAAGISPTSQDEDVARKAIHDKIERLEEKLAELENSGSSKEAPSFEETLADLTAQYPLRDKVLLIKAGVAFIFVLFLFFTHSVPGLLHISLGWSALIAAFLLLVISDRRDLEAILVRIEWSTLLFFAALFIVMESLSLLGVIELIGAFVVHVISSVEAQYQLALAICIVVWVSGIASAFLDNIPVTTMMVKIIIRLAEDNDLNLPLHPLVWSLAFGACFGGNGTLIGASANVVTAGVSEQHGYKISFVRFFIVCFPVMLGNLFVATVYLLVSHVVFTWHEQNPPNLG